LIQGILAKLNDVTTFLDKLQQVAPYCAKWAKKAIYNANKWWDRLSLHDPTLHVLAAFSKDLDDRAFLQISIFLSTTTVLPMSVKVWMTMLFFGLASSYLPPMSFPHPQQAWTSWLALLTFIMTTLMHGTMPIWSSIKN
jgi:hypothetical protein